MSATDVAIEQGVLVETDGMRFEVDMAGDPESQELALLLHGFPELNFSWRLQLPLFARLGYRVWAPNQRGYGRSTRPKGIRAYTIDHLVEDVCRMIDASGKKSVTLVGHDWGGAVAWSFALARARPLTRLIVMNLPHPAIFARKLRTGSQLRKSWYAFFFQVPKLPEMLLRARRGYAIGESFRGMAIDKSRFPDEVLDVYRNHACEKGALTAMINWYRATRYLTPTYRALFENPPILDTPTLMIWGEKDAALGKELTFGTDELVRDFTLRYLPNVSHWVQQEAPETVNAMVEAWLRGDEVPHATGAVRDP